MSKHVVQLTFVVNVSKRAVKLTFFCKYVKTRRYIYIFVRTYVKTRRKIDISFEKASTHVVKFTFVFVNM